MHFIWFWVYIESLILYKWVVEGLLMSTPICVAFRYRALYWLCACVCVCVCEFVCLPSCLNFNSCIQSWVNLDSITLLILRQPTFNWNSIPAGSIPVAFISLQEAEWITTFLILLTCKSSRDFISSCNGSLRSTCLN